jgi:hypothetical protein
MLRFTRWLTALLGLALLAANSASAVAAFSGQNLASGSPGSLEHRLGANAPASPDRFSEKLVSLYDLASDFPVAAKGAFQIAKEGGKHAGFLRNYLGRSPAEIQKGITSFEKQIAEHQAKIANPSGALSNWRTLDPRQQQALLNQKWPGAIQRLSEQADILRGLLGGGP